MLQEEEGKKDTMKRRGEKGDDNFFRAVNNTFLQISQQRKISVRERLRHAQQRERERKREK